MLNPAHLIADALGEELVHIYRDMFGDRDSTYASIARTAAKLVIERIANSDALYHDSHHTVMVTLVGQAIFRARMLVEQLTREDWLHFTVALLLPRHRLPARHLPRRLRGRCFVIDEQGDTVRPPRGASDAFLTPYHIERGKIFVAHRCAHIDVARRRAHRRAIELTRFPVPKDNDHAETDTEAGLVRAADLIGQLADPFYPRKLNALYHEFAETGVAEQLGYQSPGRRRRALPPILLGARSSPISATRYGTCPARSRASSGSPTCMRMCSSRNTPAGGWARNGARRRPDDELRNKIARTAF